MQAEELVGLLAKWTGYVVFVAAGWFVLMVLITLLVNRSVEWLGLQKDLLEAARRMFNERAALRERKEGHEETQ